MPPVQVRRSRNSHYRACAGAGVWFGCFAHHSIEQSGANLNMYRAARITSLRRIVLQRWRWFFACSILVLGAACMDGYPTEAEPALHPLDMTPAQRMLEMNRVGEEVDAGRHWSYEMRPGCVLRIDIDGEHGSFPSLDLPLLGAEVKINPDKEEGTFEVTIQRRDAPSEQGWAVLESRRWGDVSWMQLLLRVAQKECVDVVGNSQGR